MEKWKKYLIFSIGFFLLEICIAVTIGWSESDVQGQLFHLLMRVLPAVTLILAYDNWRERKGKKDFVFKFNWKKDTMLFFVLAIASYLFVIYLYLYPGTAFTLAESQFLGAGAVIYGTVCLCMAFYTAWHRVRLTEELDVR
ncbi:MAG: hypothetical protein ACFFFK_01475 [Candidatus Thorarchaeota archaeon]